MRLKVKPKRIVSLALAGCMAVSMVPASAVTAFAAENTNVPAISTGTEGEEENQSKSVTVEVTEAGKLEEAVKAEAQKQGIALSDITELTVKGGPLNAADFQFMSGVKVTEDGVGQKYSFVYAGAEGYEGESFDWLSGLKVLDLSGATFENNEVPPHAFRKNDRITKIVLPDSVERIRIHAFSSMSELTYLGTIAGNLEFPTSLKILGSGAFFKDAKLTGKLVIPDSITHIGAACFQESGVGNKESVTIPADVEMIENVDAEDGMGTVGDVFKHANNIAGFVFESGITEIGPGFANECSGFESIAIPDTVTKIDARAFRQTGLKGTVVIPESVAEIGEAAFAKCYTVENFIVENPNVALSKYSFTELSSGAKLYFTGDTIPQNEDNYWNNVTILLATAGGTIDTTKGFDSDTGLYTPEKSDGSRFDGWYEEGTDTQVTSKNDLVNGKKYVAKWTSNPSELTTDIGEKTFVVGEPVEFSFTTTANGDEGTPVIGTSNFSDTNAIEKLEYYEVNTPEGEDPWKPVTSDIGGSDGFPMADKELKFRVTFEKEGDYTFTASMKKAGTDTVLCSTEVNFTVGTMQAAATVTDEDGTSMTSYKANEPVRVTLKAAPNDPEAFKKNTLSLTYGDEVEKVELNGHELSEKSYQISDLLDMMDPADAQIAVQAVNAGETITIPLDVTYKTNGEHPFKMEVRNNAGTTVCEKEVTVKISDEEPMPVGSHTLTVKGGTVKVNGAKVDLEKNLTTVPEDATVEVTFDQDAFADSGLKFGHWDIKGLEDPNAYQDKESFTFTMPAGDVTLEAMPQDATIEDGPDILGTAAVITTAAVGGAVLAWQGYQIGTELYLTYLLPAGAAIPANTAELAKLVWTDAGKPAPAAVLPEDATEEQQAMAWTVESGLISADKAPDASVSKTDVIKTWKKAQERKG